MIQGIPLGAIKGATRSLENGSYEAAEPEMVTSGSPAKVLVFESSSRGPLVHSAAVRVSEIHPHPATLGVQVPNNRGLGIWVMNSFI